jgi:hypothetical protein
VSITSVADGPAMFLGSSIMSFALPYAAFIVVATVLFLLFRARHSLPRLKYMSATGTVSSFMTREPGPVPAPAAAPETAAPETAAPETAAPETAAPETAAPETAAPETMASPEEPE